MEGQAVGLNKVESSIRRAVGRGSSPRVSIKRRSVLQGLHKVGSILRRSMIVGLNKGGSSIGLQFYLLNFSKAG